MYIIDINKIEIHYCCNTKYHKLLMLLQVYYITVIIKLPHIIDAIKSRKHHCIHLLEIVYFLSANDIAVIPYMCTNRKCPVIGKLSRNREPASTITPPLCL